MDWIPGLIHERLIAAMKRPLFAMLFLFLLVGSFLGGAWYNQRETGKSQDAQGKRRVLHYVDPMNPAHTSDKPGIAPCGMPMEPVYSDDEPTGLGPQSAALMLSPGSVKITPQKQQIIGVQVGTVEMVSETHGVRTLGRIAPDENNVYRLIAATDGWMSDVYGSTTGSMVHQHQLMAVTKIYNSDFFAWQQKYLVELGTTGRQRQSLTTVPGARQPGVPQPGLQQARTPQPGAQIPRAGQPGIAQAATPQSGTPPSEAMPPATMQQGRTPTPPPQTAAPQPGTPPSEAMPAGGMKPEGIPSAAPQPDCHQPEAHTHEAHQPEAQIPGAPQAGTPQTAAPQTGTPPSDVMPTTDMKPEGTPSAAPQPGGHPPEAHKHEAPQPWAQIPGARQPGGLQSEGLQPAEKWSSAKLSIADYFINKSKLELLNLGVAETQLEELERTKRYETFVETRSPVIGLVLARSVSPGQRVERGTELFKVADLSRVWVIATVFDLEAQYIRPGMSAKISLPRQNKSFEATVSDVPPVFDPATRTLKVRLEVNNPGYVFRPEMYVDVDFLINLPPAITVPADAVLDSGRRKTVFVAHGNGFFEPRKVVTGWRFGDRVEILEGLIPGEQIVISGNFLIDSESRMKLAAAGLYGATEMDPICNEEVYPSRAKAAGLTSEFEGKTYYFYTADCKAQFDQEHGQGSDESAAGSGQRRTPGSVDDNLAAHGFAKDPVCGMPIPQGKTRAAGLTSGHAGQTYFFCSEECKQYFDKAPEPIVERARRRGARPPATQTQTGGHKHD
jgi:RND family efflux transporter MFP subunit